MNSGPTGTLSLSLSLSRRCLSLLIGSTSFSTSGARDLGLGIALNLSLLGLLDRIWLGFQIGIGGSQEFNFVDCWVVIEDGDV